MKNLFTILAIPTLLFLSSCEKSERLLIQETKATEESSKNAMCFKSYDLMAGQHMLAGNVTVTNTVNNIIVTYTTTNGWTLHETHLYVGDVQAMPVNASGHPKIGHFPNSQNHNGVTTYTYIVPIVPGQYCYAVAAHAVVSNQMGIAVNGNQRGQMGSTKTGGSGSGNETAWSVGTPFTNNGWAMYSEYCLCPLN